MGRAPRSARGLLLAPLLLQPLASLAAGSAGPQDSPGCIAAARPAAALVPGLHASEPEVVVTTAEMDRTGLMFPDGNLGVVRRAAGQYTIWAAAGTFGGVTRVPRLATGTYRFTGTLQHLAPAADGDTAPAAALLAGGAQPSPDGSDFDRDYAGGGPTYPVSLASGSSALLQIYHGEFDAMPGVGRTAYGGSGLALSTDGGRLFGKLGQVLAPHLSREEFFRSGRRGGSWADASMVEADARGHRVSAPEASAEERERYLYLIFTDHHQIQERCIGLSLARIRKGELLAALTAHRVPEFRKLYRPSGADSWRAGDFSQPGLGGDSTPLIAAAGDYINSPSIAYDAAIGRYVLSYQVNQKQVRISTSDDLYHWSDPQLIDARAEDSSRRLFYPSLVGGGDDPQLLGRMFYVYFLERDRDAHGRFSNPRLLRQRLESGAR